MGAGASSSLARAACETTTSFSAAVKTPAATNASAVRVTVETKAPWLANGAWSHSRSRNVGPSVPGDGMPDTGTS